MERVGYWMLIYNFTIHLNHGLGGLMDFTE